MTVINLEQWTVEKLATELKPRFFKESGTLLAGVADVGSVERWRKAARLAGRSLEQPVRSICRPMGPRSSCS